MTIDDPLLSELASLDPTRAEEPPREGSPRDRRILERAMTSSGDGEISQTRRAHIGDRQRRWGRLAALVAAAAAVAGFVFVMATPGGDGNVAVTLTSAADQTARIDTFRVLGTYTRENQTSILQSDVAGANSRTTFTALRG